MQPSDPATPVLADTQTLRKGDQQDRGDNADHGANEVELEDVAFANLTRDDSADDSTANSKQHRHQRSDVLTAGQHQASEDSNHDPDDNESEDLHDHPGTPLCAR